MAKDHFLLRVGKADNPVVFQSANYTQDLLHKSSDDSLFISHKASGANSFRYSMDWGVHYSDWQPYVGGKTQVNMSAVDASKGPKGKHVILEYWSKLAGSSSHVQHSDLTTTIETQPSKRFPHIYPQGRFNKFGYDGYFGSSGMEQQHDGTWTYAFMDEWPSSFVLNVLGLDKKGKPDRNVVFGDHNKDGVLDRIPPESFATNVIKIKDGPKAPYLAWQLEINDGTLRYDLKPIGSRSFQMRVFFTLLFMPAVLAIFAAFTFKRMFYQINLHGLEQQAPSSPIRTLITTLKEVSAAVGGRGRTSPQTEISRMTLNDELNFKHARKTVLIATLEYSIPRWNIEVKIG
ncbi:alpha-1,3-glucan synthase-like protein [Phlyctema vagabunda]|uniref:Alpha-1,3-glucan synthase-like protein n=1 Tax=Phlyctema vagabunda TaxID=108571 RepID=A0ABR4PAX6_9HELO